MRNRAHLIIAVLLIILAWAVIPGVVAVVVTLLVLLSFLGYL